MFGVNLWLDPQKMWNLRVGTTVLFRTSDQQTAVAGRGIVETGIGAYIAQAAKGAAVPAPGPCPGEDARDQQRALEDEAIRAIFQRHRNRLTELVLAAVEAEKPKPSQLARDYCSNCGQPWPKKAPLSVDKPDMAALCVRLGCTETGPANEHRQAEGSWFYICPKHRYP